MDSTIYRQLIGILLYLTHSRPDICYAVNVVSRYMQQPHELHWREAKRILQYIHGTRSYGIHYAANFELDLVGFTYFDWEGDRIDRKSTYGYVFMFGGGSIFLSSNKQDSISLSSTEVEYKGAVNACIQVVWLQGILSEFEIGCASSAVLFCDNQSAIKISWIQFSGRGPNILRSICTTSRSWCMTGQLFCNTSPQMSRLQIFSPRNLL